jgi:hypothetical protein
VSTEGDSPIFGPPLRVRAQKSGQSPKFGLDWRGSRPKGRARGFGPEKERYLDGAATSRALNADEDVRRRYLDYCQLHFTLELELQTLSAVEKVHQQIDLEPELPLLAPSSIPIFLPTALHDTTGFFSSGWPVAYLAATVIVGVGLLIGSLVHVSHSVQIARQSAPLHSPLSSLPSVVGRITGMVDWRRVHPGLRLDGNHLRYRRQGRSAGTGHL